MLILVFLGFLFLVFFLEKTLFDLLVFLFITNLFNSDMPGKTPYITSICLTVWGKVDCTSTTILSEFTFPDEMCSSTTMLVLLSHGIWINIFFWTFLLFFLVLFYLSIRFFSLKSLKFSINFHLVSKILAVFFPFSRWCTC